jgi:F-type H+-transporting ATPase subunit delta
MPLARHQKDFAKKLTHLSLDEGGQVDPARVETVLAALRAHPARTRRALLKAYLHYLAAEDRRGRLLYEYSGLVDPAQLETLRARYAQKYARVLRLELRSNPQLLAGLRLTIGDDIYEYSAAGRLAALAGALA